MGLRVLVLEDDKQLQRTWRRMLGRRGHMVTVVATLAECRKSMAESVPQVLLLDRQLDGEDGWSMKEEAPPDVHIVLMTGNPPLDAPPHYLKGGTPIDDLYAMIENGACLNRRSDHDERTGSGG